MLTLDELEARRAAIGESPDLQALLKRLQERARPVLDRMPPVPEIKALLSRDGGSCPDDATPLEFDPWSPESHRCPHCGKSWSGGRHHAHWARAQHLWLAERAAHLAALHAMTGDEACSARAREILGAYHERYHASPNRDNVLGPSHLFFSTYLESIWILDYLAAAFLLRECNQLTDEEMASIDAIADEAASLISEFVEAFSNRQVWHSAARTAIAVWFGDEELALAAIEDRMGLLGQLGHGFGNDGMWHEGENYHLFALRGLMIGLTWAGLGGTDIRSDSVAAAHLGAALMAPAVTSLPDLTFPARKDSRYGVSLAHPAYVESWESGLAMLGEFAPPELAAWLHALYTSAPQPEETYDSYLHDAGMRDLPRRRTELSWWSLLFMVPELPDAPAPWHGTSVVLDEQGLAIIRDRDSYVSLECSGGGGGHGHPDRLHLTWCDRGVPWLVDPGTGSYVTRDLFWYRSTLAHNAPLLDGTDQSASEPARCTAFDESGPWHWISGRWGQLTRSVIAGPAWTLDLVTGDFSAAHQLDLPWHPAGDLEWISPESWQPYEAANGEFVTRSERSDHQEGNGALHVRATVGEAALDLWHIGHDTVVRSEGPGLPRRNERRPFHVQSATGMQVQLVTVLDRMSCVTDVSVVEGAIVIHEGDRRTTLRVDGEHANIVPDETKMSLGAARPAPPVTAPLLRDVPQPTRGAAMWVDTPPALDGTLTGFDRSAPLLLDTEHHYFRTETPYPGSDVLAARAFVNWSDDALFVAVDVRKAALILPGRDAPPLDLDNEPDDINADGVQVYLKLGDGDVQAWLVRPLPDGALGIRPIGAASDTSATGAWQVAPRGYRITLAISAPGLHLAGQRAPVRFDLAVNEMQPGRQRRAGQLIWSGGGGWAYLRGDRQHPDRFGALELIG